MDFNAEVEYRLARWLVVMLWQKELVTKEESGLILEKLLDEFDPPTRSVEITDVEFPEGELWPQ